MNGKKGHQYNRTHTMKEIYMEVKNYKKIGVIIFVATAVASLVTLSKMSAEEPIQEMRTKRR